MYIHNQIIKNIPGVIEICAAEDAWHEHNEANPNKAGKAPNVEVVGESYFYYESDDPVDFQGYDDTGEIVGYMTPDETRAYLAWDAKSTELYNAWQQAIADNPYGQKALMLDLSDWNKPTEGTVKALARLEAGDDYKAVLDEYEANPGGPIGDF